MKTTLKKIIISIVVSIIATASIYALTVPDTFTLCAIFTIIMVSILVSIEAAYLKKKSIKGEHARRIAEIYSEITDPEERREVRAILSEKDAITNVRSAAVFHDMIYNMNRANITYGIVVIKNKDDIANNEKTKDLCNIICNLYAHSPVFRMAEDEFAVILTRKELDKARKLESIFRLDLTDRNMSQDMTDEKKHHVSIGFADNISEIECDVYAKATSQL